MKSHKTHEMITNFWMPYLDKETIGKVDRAIDNPSSMDIMLQNMQRQVVGKNFQLPGMFQGGHRQYNHDAISLMMKGLTEGGVDGMYAAMMHGMIDLFSDSMVSSIGLNGRDLFESAFLYALDNQKSHKRKSKSIW